MTQHVRSGMVFGQLTVVEIVAGKTSGKPKAVCKCVCGKEHSTFTTQLIHRKARRCKSCANRLPEGEAAFRRKLDQYRANARHKNRAFTISVEQFRVFHDGDCFYCGNAPAKGIDRRNNSLGYTEENSVSCCAQCNYAKRSQAEADFIAWVCRIAIRQGFSL